MQLDLFAEPPAPAVHYPTYWEMLKRMPQVGDYVTPNSLFLRGGPGLVIEGKPWDGVTLYLTGEVVRVTAQVAEDLWDGVVDMGYVWGKPWGKDGWNVRFGSGEVHLTSRRPNRDPDRHHSLAVAE